MGKIIQFTGLSGVGKTSIANAVKQSLELAGYSCEIIDGDHYRQNLCKDLGFSKADRIENVRRLGLVASKMAKDNDAVIISAINPYQESRNQLHQDHLASLVFIDCELKTLIKRDTKGLYRRAYLPQGHKDKISNLTGVNDRFDPPVAPALILSTENQSLEACSEKLKNYILSIF